MRRSSRWSTRPTTPPTISTGTFTAPTGEGFVVTGDSLPSPLAAGEDYEGLYISVNTADLGANGMSLTFDPEDVNDSGYSKALTPLTLKIVDSVVAAAKPRINTPTTIIFPNVHVGATVSQHVSVTNTAATRRRRSRCHVERKRRGDGERQGHGSRARRDRRQRSQRRRRHQRRRGA